MASITVTLATTPETITCVMDLSDSDAVNILTAYKSNMPGGTTDQQVLDLIVTGLCQQLTGTTQAYLDAQATATAEANVTPPVITQAS